MKRLHLWRYLNLDLLFFHMKLLSLFETLLIYWNDWLIHNWVWLPALALRFCLRFSLIESSYAPFCFNVISLTCLAYCRSYKEKKIRYLLSYHLITKEDESLQLFYGTVGHLLISEGHECLPSQVSHLSYRYLNDLTIGHKQVIQWDLHLYVPTHSVVNSTIYKWEICLPYGLTFSHKFLTYRVGTGFTTCF